MDCGFCEEYLISLEPMILLDFVLLYLSVNPPEVLSPIWGVRNSYFFGERSEADFHNPHQVKHTSGSSIQGQAFASFNNIISGGWERS